MLKNNKLSEVISEVRWYEFRTMCLLIKKILKLSYFIKCFTSTRKENLIWEKPLMKKN